MIKNAKSILVNLKVRVLAETEDENEIRELTKLELIKLIENNDFEIQISPDLENPFSTKDAINLALQELHNTFVGINASAEGIIKNRVKELMGENYNEDDFTQEWHFDLLRK